MRSVGAKQWARSWWLRTTCSSQNCSLERALRAADLRCSRAVVLVNQKKKGKHQRKRHDVEKKKKETGSAGRLGTHRSLKVTAVDSTAPASKMERPGGVACVEMRGE